VKGEPPAPPSSPVGDADTEAWVRDGLRALREQRPSAQSSRATLERLGIDARAAQIRAQGRSSAALVSAGRWLVWGLVLGLIAVSLRYFFLR
jgi:hypothetical protein